MIEILTLNHFHFRKTEEKEKGWQRWVCFLWHYCNLTLICYTSFHNLLKVNWFAATIQDLDYLKNRLPETLQGWYLQQWGSCEPCKKLSHMKKSWYAVYHKTSSEYLPKAIKNVWKTEII